MNLMIPDKTKVEELLRKYAPDEEQYELISTHGKIVAEIALESAKYSGEKVNLEILEAACLLHDIGSYSFIGAANHHENYERLYPLHSLLGAKILQDEGIDERIWKAVETHVLLGLTAAEIKETGKPLPQRNYEPKTIEGRILCYADRFHSKKPIFNKFDTFYDKLLNSLPMQAEKMRLWSEEFGKPDIEALAKKYNHSVK